MDESTILPLDVFRIEREKTGVSDPTYGLFHLPGGKFLVWSDVNSWRSFDSQEDAARYIGSQKGLIHGAVIPLDPKDFPLYFKSETTIDFTPREADPRLSTPNARAGNSPTDENIDQPETRQQDRSETQAADNNRPQNLEENTLDDAPDQNSRDRAGKTGPGDSLGDRIQGEVTDFFGNGQRAASTLKGQLEDYVSDGGDPILGALGATGLDALSLAMGFADSTISSYLDLRNFGEGFKKGTRAGVVEDLGRVATALPAGKAAKVLAAVLTGEDVIRRSEEIIEAATQGNGKAVTAAVASAATAILMRKLASGKGKSVKMEAHFLDGKRTIMVPKKVLREAAKQSQKLNSSLSGPDKKYNTLAVFVAYDPKTKKTYIPVSSNKSNVQKKFRKLFDDDTEHLPGINRVGPDKNNLNHAEVNGVTSIWGTGAGDGHGVVMVFPSNAACKTHCRPMLEKWGIPVVDPPDLKAFLRSLRSKS